MKRMRLFTTWTLISLVVMGAIFLWTHNKAVFFNRPNIILFSADTLRADHLSCYGYFRKTSPNIDAFAKDSVLFKKAISQSPLTTPAHMSLFTSLTPPVHLCISNLVRGDAEIIPIVRLDDKIKTLPQLLKKNGYITQGFHGGGNMDGAIGFDKGFDSYRGWTGLWSAKSALVDVRKAIQESKEKRRPLFLFLHNFICHSPYLRSPPEFNLKFLSERVAGLPLPKDVWGTCDAKAIPDEVFWKNVDLSNPQHLKHVVSLYDGGISFEDHIFGEVVELLKKEKLYDNSIVIFVSDHGEEFYEHLGKTHGRLFIEHLQVPLIIKFPGNKFAAKVIHEWVRTMDILPTLFDVLDINITTAIQGISFSPLITGRSGYSPLVVSYVNDEGSEAVRLNKDFFVYFTEKTKKHLFDIGKDPPEKNNLAAKNPRVLDQMQLMAKDIFSENEVFREKAGFKANRVSLPEKENDEMVSQLKALGYLQ